MSYDISLEANLGGAEPARVGDLDWNYTYNIQPMTERAGLKSLHDLNGKKAKDAAAILEFVLNNMDEDAEGYRALNPANGWGDYDGFTAALRELLAAFYAAPEATVRVC